MQFILLCIWQFSNQLDSMLSQCWRSKSGNSTTSVHAYAPKIWWQTEVADFLFVCEKHIFSSYSNVFVFRWNHRGLETLIYIVHEAGFLHNSMIKSKLHQWIVQNQMCTCHNVVTSWNKRRNLFFTPKTLLQLLCNLKFHTGHYKQYY